jgi:hypothetical protein
MLAFLDFEASSLRQNSYPIEVAWVFEDSRAEEYLIRPAPGWTEWDAAAEAVHRIDRGALDRDGRPLDAVAFRMVEALDGHDILASAPSWDGKWLSALLRAADLPRHRLRLRRTDDVIADHAAAVLAPIVPSASLDAAVADLIARARHLELPPAHRALADAKVERERWGWVMDEARALAGRHG